MENFSKPRSFLSPLAHSHPLPKALARSMPPHLPQRHGSGCESQGLALAPAMTPATSPPSSPATRLASPGAGLTIPIAPVRRSPGPRLPAGRAEATGLAFSPPRIAGS